MPSSRNSHANSPSSPSDADTLAKRGRQLVRIVDMWWSGSDLVSLGKQMEPMSDDVILNLHENANKRKLRLITLVEKLNEWEPTLFERLNKPSPHAAVAARDAKSRLNIGQSNGRSEDARKVREAMPKWEEWSPPLGDKSSRGLKHKRCAYYLSSPELDFENEEVVTKFMAYGIPAMSPSRWPRFLWAKGKFDPQNPAAGLLEGDLLFSASMAVLFSPSASMPSTVQASGARGHIRRRGPIGVAKRYQMTEVTPGFIAYIACVTRHALTSDDQFSEASGGFSYVEFYYQIREFLEGPQFTHWTEVLINRWNERLFSRYNFGDTTSTASAPANATLALLTAQLEGGQVGPEMVGLGGSD